MLLSLAERRRRAAMLLRDLNRMYPDPQVALNHSNVWELVVATILSAQCTDKLVNRVTGPLFAKYPTLDDYVAADPAEFEADLSSVNFYKNKAKHILAAARIVRETYGGEVPQTMEQLMSLPGVARKTANVVTGAGFGKPMGIVVDTHVKRLAKLYGLTDQDDPVKVERDLIELIPKTEWIQFSLRLILYGREHCPARPHDHAHCPLTISLSSSL